MERFGRLAVASLLSVSLSGCECGEICRGFSLEVYNAATDEPVQTFEVAYAESIYGPRTYQSSNSRDIGSARIEDSGHFRVWVRAPGYRDWYGSVDAPEICVDRDVGCPARVKEVALVPR